jgi:hypothetical protein
MSLLEIKGVVDDVAPDVVDVGKRFVAIEDLCLLGAELLHGTVSLLAVRLDIFRFNSPLRLLPVKEVSIELRKMCSETG